MTHADKPSRPDALLIAGPTASGKSALALRLAARLGGIVVNADSMQVYRDLRIITARPSAEAERQVPHLLFGTIDGGEAFSVSRWLAAVARELDLAAAREQLPIVVGGTGLYFKALTQGLSAIPPIPDAIRSEIRAWAHDRSAGDLHATLTARDPVMAARLRPTDPQRIVRALEVHQATGKSLASFHHQREAPRLDLSRCQPIYLTPDRGELHERIDQRFDRMMIDGALSEVEHLAARRLDPASPVMRALGVPPLLKHLEGEFGLAEAIAEAKASTRRYVKRQHTFARNQLSAFRPVHPEAAEILLYDAAQL